MAFSGKSAAAEDAQDGIRVNCVNPGYIKTPMTKETGVPEDGGYAAA